MITVLRRSVAAMLLGLLLCGCGPDTQPAAPTEEVRYILNRSSGIFHFPNCPSVGRMKEKNKVLFSGTREEAIAAGYEPCRKCRP